MNVTRTTTQTRDGWRLCLHRRAPALAGKPVVLLPGYGMNSFAFRYHTSGISFMETLATHGFDAWSVDFRGSSLSWHEHSCKHGGPVGLPEQAFIDLPTCLEHICARTGHERVHVIGCSLGGALAYAYAGEHREHRIDRLVTMGTPLQWGQPSVVRRIIDKLAWPVRKMPVRGTRPLARWLLPLGSRWAPKAISIYINPRLTDTSDVENLACTIENPHPAISDALLRWISNGDLILDGRNTTENMEHFERPLFVICGSGDLICPQDAAMAALEHSRGETTFMCVDDPQGAVGHADLFISSIAPERVFSPVAEWLQGKSGLAS